MTFRALDLPDGIPATVSEKEQGLLEEVIKSRTEEERAEALWQLVQFYSRHATRNDLSKALLNLIIQNFPNVGRTALCYLMHGRIAQFEKNWGMAVKHYRDGLALSPTDPETAYFLNYHLASCLNSLGHYAEAEQYCRRAIQVDGGRHNAYKTLGISLQAQGDLIGAAWAWIDAVKLNRMDQTTFRLLDTLVKKYPNLLNGCDWISLEFKNRWNSSGESSR